MNPQVMIKRDHFTCTKCKIIVVGFIHYKIHERDHKRFPSSGRAKDSVVKRDHFICPTCQIIVVGLAHYKIHEMDHKRFPKARRSLREKDFGGSRDLSKDARKRSQAEAAQPGPSKLAKKVVPGYELRYKCNKFDNVFSTEDLLKIHYMMAHLIGAGVVQKKAEKAARENKKGKKAAPLKPTPSKSKP